MLRTTRILLLAPALLMLACSQPSAQSQQEVETLKKEIATLKESLTAIQRDLQEVREFLKAATGGRFGAPSLENSSIDLGDAPAYGPAAAPITLVEVSDYHCPFCRRHVQQTQPQIYSDYVKPGKVRHVFIHYPIDQLHPDAYRSHEAASCAQDQGKFWDLHARLFESPAKTIDQIVAVAESAGLDAGALRACLKSGRHSAAVKASVAQMQQLGIDSTPTFLVGLTPAEGEPMKVLSVVRGAHPFEQFKTVFDGLLDP